MNDNEWNDFWIDKWDLLMILVVKDQNIIPVTMSANNPFAVQIRWSLECCSLFKSDESWRLKKKYYDLKGDK